MSIKSKVASKMLQTDFGMSLIYRLKNEKPNLKIMNPQETLDYVEKHQCSVARFGEGEFELILWQERNLGFQDHSDELTEKLEEVLASEPEKLLLCIPYALNDIKGRTRKSMEFWYYWAEKKEQRKLITDLIKKYHGNDYLFGDTQISRPYIAWKTPQNAEAMFPRLMNLWKDKDIMIVEGEKTRLGIGNDLLVGARSVKRILCPATNAFDHYSEILDMVKEHNQGELVILALGPTATVLAADLAEENIQAFDIGHLDIEYEWYLSKATEHAAVAGKYTNEADCGDEVDNCANETYLSQIIAKVAC